MLLRQMLLDGSFEKDFNFFSCYKTVGMIGMENIL